MRRTVSIMTISLMGLYNAHAQQAVEAPRYADLPFANGRTAKAILPANMDDDPIDVVYLFHGYGMNADEIFWVSNMESFVTDYDVLVVAPNLDHRDGPDEFNALKTVVENQFNVSNSHGVGYSWGARQMYTWSVSTPGVLAAVVAVSGASPVEGLETASQTIPFPTMIIHGTADTAAPIDGGLGFAGLTYRPISDTVDAMVAANQCSSEPTVLHIDEQDDGTSAMVQQYVCARYIDHNGVIHPFDVTYVEVENMGHGFVGMQNAPVEPALIHPISQEINSEHILQFLKSHSHRMEMDGDFNRDTVIGPIDINLMSEQLARRQHDRAFDLTGDGLVTLSDQAALLDAAGRLNGDADFDGLVSFSDFLILSANFGQRRALWSEGNFDPTVRGVGFEDFLILSANFGSESTATAVPEPSSAVVALVGVGSIFLRRKFSLNGRQV